MYWGPCRQYRFRLQTKETSGHQITRGNLLIFHPLSFKLRCSQVWIDFWFSWVLVLCKSSHIGNSEPHGSGSGYSVVLGDLVASMLTFFPVVLVLLSSCPHSLPLLTHRLIIALKMMCVHSSLPVVHFYLLYSRRDAVSLVSHIPTRYFIHFNLLGLRDKNTNEEAYVAGLGNHVSTWGVSISITWQKKWHKLFVLKVNLHIHPCTSMRQNRQCKII